MFELVPEHILKCLNVEFKFFDMLPEQLSKKQSAYLFIDNGTNKSHSPDGN